MLPPSLAGRSPLEAFALAYDTYTGDYNDEQALIAYLLALHQHARLQRINFETQWEEVAALIWPEYRNSFSFGHVRAPGVKYTQYQVDSTGAIKAQRFMAIADAMITPFNMMWSKVTTDNAYLLKQRAARQYFEDWTQVLWDQRYKPEANFMTQQQTNWHSLGVFGNQYMWVDELEQKPGGYQPGLRYISSSVGEIYRLVNYQGRTDGCIRYFRWTARQAAGKWGEQIPPQLRAALDKGDEYTRYDFLHFVLPRTDYDPHRIFSPRGKPWASIYVSVVGWKLLEIGGYTGFPLACGGFARAPEEWYDRGPGQQVLPELKTKNSEKEVFLKQGRLAGDPAYLAPSDDLFQPNYESGATNYGGMTEDGKPLVTVLPTGNIQITKELMEDSDRNIDAAFLNDLFPLLFNTKNNQQKSAREVIEVANQVGIFLAPTLGRQFGEYIGTMHRREMQVIRQLGLAPKMPDVVREAKGEFKFIYTSPLGRAINAQGIAGYMRSVEMATQIAQSSGDNSVFDAFDFNTALPDISEQQFSPVRWMASTAQKAAKAKARAAAQKAEQDMKSLPGQAAIMKANAITAKAQTGGNTGGTLSGMPEGGMPTMPGQSGPGGRAFGQPGPQ